MFDISLAKLFVLGIVALIVLGPEKLPAVARFAGVMIGRAQRFASNVKAEMNDQLQESGLNDIQQNVKDLTQDVRETLQSALLEVQDSLKETSEAYREEKEKVVALQQELIRLKSITPQTLINDLPVKEAVMDAKESSEKQQQSPEETHEH